MLHNVATGPSFTSLVRPLGLNCMDSSVDTQACANSASVSSATLEYGNYLSLTVSSGYPIGITDISVNSNSVYAATGFGSSTFQNDNAWMIDCSDLVRDDLCVRFATSATCQAYLCPTCQYAGMCDFSCGYCDSRRAFSKTHTLTLKTTDFGLPATDFTGQPVIVSYRTNPAIASGGDDQLVGDTCDSCIHGAHGEFVCWSMWRYSAVWLRMQPDLQISRHVLR